MSNFASVTLFGDQVLDQFAAGTGPPVEAERKLGRARESHPDHRRHQPVATSFTKRGLDEPRRNTVTLRWQVRSWTLFAVAGPRIRRTWFHGLNLTQRGHLRG
jgi:hypothetical protein